MTIDKIAYCLVTTEEDEPLAVQSYITAYEATGKTWTGTKRTMLVEDLDDSTVSDTNVIDVFENIEADDFTAVLPILVEQGYQMVIRNSQLSLQSFSAVKSALEAGVLLVNSAGSNQYQGYIPTNQNHYATMFVGTSFMDSDNTTGFPVVFLDAAEAETGKDIQVLRQCGTSYSVASIARISATHLGVKLTGVTDPASIGITEHGIPLYFSDMSGTDISPLPSGLKFTDFQIDGDVIYIKHNTTSGAINFNYRTVSGGAIKYGYTDSTRCMMISDKLQGASATTAGLAIVLDGVTGFQNNINGIQVIADNPNDDLWANKLLFTFNLGTGSYEGNGTISTLTQSYAAPSFAGKAADTRERRGGSWFDTIGALMVTASRYDVEEENSGFTEINGFGSVNVLEASEYRYDGMLDTPELSVVQAGDTTFQFTWHFVPFAEEYELWKGEELFQTLTAHQLFYTYSNVARVHKANKQYFRLRAKQGTRYSQFSNAAEVKRYYSKYIAYKISA